MNIDGNQIYEISGRDLARVRRAVQVGQEMEHFLDHAKAVFHAINAMDAFTGLPVNEEDRESQDAGNLLLDQLAAEASRIDPNREDQGQLSLAGHILDKLKAVKLAA